MKKRTIMFSRADQWYDGSFNLNIPNWASQRQLLARNRNLHQVTRWCPKTPSDDPMENPGSVGGQFSSGVYELEAKFTVTVI